MRRGLWVGLGILALAAVGGMTAGRTRRGAGPPVDPPSLVFLGADVGAPFGMAAFALHNPASNAVFLHRTEVQVLDQGVWRTESDAPVQVVHRQWPHFGTTGLCEPGTGCTLATPWPESGPWRVRVVFQPECRSARWIHRAGQVVRFLDTGFWKARQWEAFAVAEGPLIFDRPNSGAPEPAAAPVSVTWEAPRVPSFGTFTGTARGPSVPVGGARTNAPR